MVGKNEPIVLFGCGRSGTSLVASILEKCGLSLGRDLGVHGEATFFQELNKFILQEAGCKWDNPLVFKNILTYRKDIKYTEKYIRQILNSVRLVKYCGLLPYLNKKHSFWRSWGWKDPRNAITLPIWTEIFPEGKFLHIKRHGIDVARSFGEKEKSKFERSVEKNERLRNLLGIYHGMRLKKSSFNHSPRLESIDSSFELWKDYMETIKLYKDEYIPEERLYEVKYENLLLNTNTVLGRLIDVLDLENRYKIKKIIDSIDKSRAYAYRNEGVQVDDQKQSVLDKFGY